VNEAGGGLILLQLAPFLPAFLRNFLLLLLVAAGAWEAARRLLGRQAAVGPRRRGSRIPSDPAQNAPAPLMSPMLATAPRNATQPATAAAKQATAALRPADKDAAGPPGALHAGLPRTTPPAAPSSAPPTPPELLMYHPRSRHSIVSLKVPLPAGSEQHGPGFAAAAAGVRQLAAAALAQSSATA
jgi:hypothetical protein